MQERRNVRPCPLLRGAKAAVKNIQYGRSSITGCCILKKTERGQRRAMHEKRAHCRSRTAAAREEAAREEAGDMKDGAASLPPLLLPSSSSSPLHSSPHSIAAITSHHIIPHTDTQHTHCTKSPHTPADPNTSPAPSSGGHHSLIVSLSFLGRASALITSAPSSRRQICLRH